MAVTKPPIMIWATISENYPSDKHNSVRNHLKWRSNQQSPHTQQKRMKVKSSQARIAWRARRLPCTAAPLEVIEAQFKMSSLELTTHFSAFLLMSAATPSDTCRHQWHAPTSCRWLVHTRTFISRSHLNMWTPPMNFKHGGWSGNAKKTQRNLLVANFALSILETLSSQIISGTLQSDL